MVDSIRGAEEEQVEALKAWWGQHGKRFTRTLIVVLAVVAAVRYYYHHEAVLLRNASLEYDLLINAFAAQEAEKAAAAADKKGIAQKEETSSHTSSATLHANRLTTEFKHTPYATLAGMMMAKKFEDSGDIDAALSALDKSMPSDPILQIIWQIRKSALLQIKGDWDGALNALSGDYPAAFESLIEERKGDLYLAKKEVDHAKKAYDQAIATDKIKRVLLQMKRDDLN